VNKIAFLTFVFIGFSYLYPMKKESNITKIVSKVLVPNSLLLDEKLQAIQSFEQNNSITSDDKITLTFLKKWYIGKELLNSSDVCEQYTRNTLLHKAIQSGNMVVAKILCEQVNVEVNVLNKEKNTPLHYAFRYGYLGFIPLLLKHGANVVAQDDQGWTPLHCAAGRNKIEELQQLLKKVKNKKDLDKKTKPSGLTPLHLACRRGYTKIAQLLLAAKANPNVQSLSFCSPLQEAQLSNNQALIGLLKEHGAIKQPSYHDFFSELADE